MSRRFAEECSNYDLEGQISKLEDEIENLKYDLDQLEEERDKLKETCDDLYDNLDHLNDATVSLESKANFHEAFGKDLVDLLLCDMRRILMHLDDNHPEIIFELLAMPDLCSDINLPDIINEQPYSGEAAIGVYQKLLKELEGAY